MGNEKHIGRIHETRRPYGPPVSTKRAPMTQSSAHSGETHAYPRRIGSDKEAPACTNSSTVVVDVIQAESPTSSKAPMGPVDATTMDHVYEEVGLFNESLNNHEKLTAVMPSHRICAQCLGSRGSPVIYSDRLIYEKQKISAVETKYFQELTAKQIYFGHNLPSQLDRHAPLPLELPHGYVGDHMPVSSLTKANASGILCSPSVATDVFDLFSSLGPGISLLNGTDNSALTNTEVYHRFANNRYSRISEIEASSAPMVFRVKSSRAFSTIKSTGYDENMIYWMNYDGDLRKQRGAKSDNRSSLLLLEPLLLMPELANPRQNPAKNRITHSEHVKIVRMVIAYTLSFFLLAIITFYIVYFT